MRRSGKKELSPYYYLDLDNVDPKIDNKPPKVEIDTYYKPQSLQADAETVMEIDKQNMELVKKLNTIHRLGGKVDCWNREFKSKSHFVENQSQADEIMKQNIALMNKIRDATGLYSTAELMREWRKSKNARKKLKNVSSNGSKSTVTSKKLIPRSSLDDVTRPRCYFEIEIEETRRKLGKITFQLFADVVPQTCENFLSFCRGIDGLSYKGTPFHRILPGYWCQGGDVTKFNGSGGTSIYGDTFPDENFQMKHSEPGILSMCAYNKNSNNSKFNLTFKRLESMDGKRVVFGKLIAGLRALREIERYGTKNGKPIMKIVVAKCGVL